MRRRRGAGGSMRSVVGFLSQRGLAGDPLLTQDFQRRRLRGCRNLYKKDLLGHFGCVNAIEFSNNGGQWLVSGNPPPPAPGEQPAERPSAELRWLTASSRRRVRGAGPGRAGPDAVRGAPARPWGGPGRGCCGRGEAGPAGGAGGGAGPAGLGRGLGGCCRPRSLAPSPRPGRARPG